MQILRVLLAVFTLGAVGSVFARQSSYDLLIQRVWLSDANATDLASRSFLFFELNEALETGNRQETCRVQQPLVADGFKEASALQQQINPLAMAALGTSSESAYLSLQYAGSAVNQEWILIQHAFDLVCQRPADYTLKTAAEMARLNMQLADMKSTFVYLLTR
ncbi:hypothetical protein MF271_18970 (plasmid) [Deinococcus sp. KNUC1210]|uniref:hypothetical protein n=1 Tax=Deinococcus sp. KNUC1210 TaxID=2917691 RepID=UPI001EEF81E8|nr:hypothetical protein [Deinococcus sp. KNUC1210]ULH17404.1 hypothetical protein MF271_18970 [Deinococcus sp. KNUC1210]